MPTIETTKTEIKHVEFREPHRIEITSTTAPELQDGQFRVETIYTGVSTGTELTFYQGTNPKSSEGWDPELRIFRDDVEPDPGETYPMVKGYMAVGKVAETLTDKVSVGDIVAMRYGHHSSYVASENEFFFVLPEGFDPQLGVLVSQLGPVCMNGILFAADHLNRKELTTLQGSLVDQRIVVFGAGMVGMLVGLFAKWAGAREVVIVDGIDERLKMAEQLGMVPMKASDELPLQIKQKWQAEPNETGADIVFQCTGSDYLLALSLSCLREQGVVVDLGFYQQGTGQVMLGKEFHHNCLQHICAQIGSQPRAQQGLWNRPKLSEEVLSFLQQHGQSLKDVLFTHTVSIDEAQDIFDRLANRDTSLMQVVFDYQSRN